MSYVGINIGALTIKIVSLDGDRLTSQVVNHQGQALQVLQRILKESPPGKSFYGICGHLGHISEAAATDAALEYVHGDFDAIASLGAETFAVYLLKGRKILTALSHNQCAAGSGEFFIQQIGRLGLSLDEAINRSFNGHVVPLASRCSVHCKSDITHKLNRKEASVEDILCTLHDSMADKVVSLLERSPNPVRRLLLIGGLAQNRALVAALQGELPQVTIVVLPESPYFEALGAAVLTRDQPIHDHPCLTVKPTLGVMAPLAPSLEQVIVMSAPPPDRSATGPFVLGVDAGSTTTKAVLLDPATRGLVASHYLRTSGDPIQATRQCVRALVDQLDGASIGLIATTGSARELIAAYLGTAHVYNEISAHAAAAIQCDPEVDTIFEIGGQDSKYILLRNRVPIDYTMNASCSAGTGSFLEECAQSDLGLALNEITDAALRAPSPVQFKATCAAFINSDIRTALQEGYSREDVAAGLVYAVVNNYLSKVKGPRAVGRRVFFQGGVALNRAVACAFAQCLGKQVTVPPHPELLGAIGVALLAIERAGAFAGDGRDLASLAEPSMQQLGHFACGACGNHCTIDRFEVAGRRFPFGGKCSRFDTLWKQTDKVAEMADLVEARNRIVFNSPASRPLGARRIGIPRALTTHSLYPLYCTFFERLGMDVVLSGINSAGALKANSGFCFPVQIAHGAVLDLIHGGTDLIFLPQVSRMPNPQAGRNSYLCPVAQASPYVIAKAFPSATILSPVLDFTNGYAASQELVTLAESQLGCSHDSARQAYEQAVAAQLQAEQSMRDLGSQALKDALADGAPTILIVGRSYNAFPAEASQSIARKLASMGMRVIPGDCLPQERAGPTAWHYPNLTMNAVTLARRHANLFLLYVSNFSCTIDAFTHSFFSSEMGDKPYLMLEIDAHTADAGIQTRLEAFRDIVANYHSRTIPGSPFKPADIDRDAVVTTSAGQRLALRDPRVHICFPTFSYYHSQAMALAAKWVGLNVGPPCDLNRQQLERGLRFTSGRECLPLPICIGQMLEAHERRQPGEVVGFYMAPGGAPCVMDCYMDYFRRFIRENQLQDLFIFAPEESNGHYGLSVREMSQSLAPVLTLADLFVEMEHTLRVVGEGDATERLRTCWTQCVATQPSVKALKSALPALVAQVAKIPHADPAQRPRVVVTGDFFLRFSPAFMDGVHERYARQGIILVPVGLNELLLYAAYAGMNTVARDWHVRPDSGVAVARACLRVFQADGRDYLAAWAEYRHLKYYDDRYRQLFLKTGLIVGGIHDIARLFEHASHHLSPTVGGEAVSTVGKGVAAGDDGFAGIIAIGPFNCLPFRVSESILKPYSWKTGMPILTYESDGFSVHPAVLRQVDVHIQQVLDHSQPVR